MVEALCADGIIATLGNDESTLPVVTTVQGDDDLAGAELGLGLVAVLRAARQPEP